MDNDRMAKHRLPLAAAEGDLDRARQLLANGHDPNAFDDLHYTPLHYAVKHEQFDMVSLLIREGANVNANNEAAIGNTPIHEHAGTCSLKMAELLLDCGADPTIRGWMQINALDIAKDRKRGDGPKVYELMKRHATKRP